MTTLVHQAHASVSEKIYDVFTAAAAAILAAIVALDLKLAAAQSFSTFVIGPGGFPVGADFLNTWMGGRSAFSNGPADWFDSDVYMAAILQVTGISHLEPMYWLSWLFARLHGVVRLRPRALCVCGGR